MANLSEAFRERCWHTSCLQHCLFVCFLLIFIGVQLLCNVVLVPAVQQREAAICRHSSPLFWISFPFRSHRASRRVLCRALGSRWLSVLYIAVVSTSAALCTLGASPSHSAKNCRQGGPGGPGKVEKNLCVSLFLCDFTYCCPLTSCVPWGSQCFFSLSLG